MKHAMTWAVGILVVLAALYVGSYYALVNTPYPLPPGFPEPLKVPADPHYRVGGETARWIFTPMHALDRKFRPEAWRTSRW